MRLLRSLMAMFLLLSFIISCLNLLVYSWSLIGFWALLGVLATIGAVVAGGHRFLNGHDTLGLVIILFGALFWFWDETISLAYRFAPFANYISYSPVAGGELPVDSVAISAFTLTSFLCALIVAWYFSRTFFNHRNSFSKTSGDSLGSEGLILVLAVLGWLPFVQTFGGVEEAFARLIRMRAEVIELEVGFSAYLPIASIACGSIALAKIVSGTSRSAKICIIAAIAGGTLALLSGTRFKLLYFMMPSLIVILYGLRTQRKKKQALVMIIPAAIATIGLATYQIVSRAAISNSANLTVTAGAWHFSPLVFSVELMKGREPFMQPMAVLFATDMIPRFVWPGKPDHIYWEYYQQLAIFGGNVTPSVLGQYYMNWSLAGGAIAGMIFGIWTGLADHLMGQYRKYANQNVLIASGFIITFIFLSYRHYAFNYMAYILPAVFIYYIFGSTRSRNKTARPAVG